MSGLPLITECCVLVVKTPEVSLSHSSVRLECQNASRALGVTECVRGARGAVVCVGVVISYPCESCGPSNLGHF